MKKMQWMLATSLVCGGALFTACSDDSSSSSTPDEPKASAEQTAFVENTRANLKDLAENLNFSSWQLANHVNKEFNERVLNNDEIDNAITRTISADIYNSITAVEKKSELGKLGYENVATVDLSRLKASFTLTKDGTFDVKEAKNFEIVLPIRNPETKKVSEESLKLTLKMGGDSYKFINKNLSLDDLAVVMKVPEEISFAISAKPEGKWEDLFTGSFKNDIRSNSKSEYVDIRNTSFNITGEVNSTIKAVELANGDKTKADATTIKFAIGKDVTKKKNGAMFDFKHNKKNMLSFYVENHMGDRDDVDLSELTNSSSIVDVITSLTAKDVDQTIPVTFETVQFGVDFWTMPALQFNKDEGYVPLVEVLDPKSIEYGINIIDHAAEPMQDAIVVVRQLMQYFQKLAGLYDDYQGDNDAE